MVPRQNCTPLKKLVLVAAFQGKSATTISMYVVFFSTIFIVKNTVLKNSVGEINSKKPARHLMLVTTTKLLLGIISFNAMLSFGEVYTSDGTAARVTRNKFLRQERG